jgi:hypothetical protein
MDFYTCKRLTKKTPKTMRLFNNNLPNNNSNNNHSRDWKAIAPLEKQEIMN